MIPFESSVLPSAWSPDGCRIARFTLTAILLLAACNSADDPSRHVSTVEVTPAADTLTVIGRTSQLSAVARDFDGDIVSGVEFSWTPQDPLIATVDPTGLVTAIGSGTTTITARVDGVNGTAVLTVKQAIAGLGFVDQPSDVAAGDTIAPSITVELVDSGGSRVSDTVVPVTLTLRANPGAATLTGTLTVTSTGGVASFNDLWLDKAASGYTLAALAADLDSVTSVTFAVGPGPALLSFFTQPSTAEGQVPFDPVVLVTAREDRFGNLVPDASVTLALAVNPSADALRGTTTVTAVNGLATFAGLNLALPGDGLVLEATSGRAVPVQSVAFSVRLTLVQLAAGDSHTCGVTVAEFAYCWGWTFGFTPYPVPGGLRFRELSAGTSYTCGITTGGAALCWGANFHGELGDGTSDSRANPTSVLGGLTFAQVSTGSGYTCGVTPANAAYCWGSNGLGQLGDGTTDQRLTPTLVGGAHSFTQVSVGGLGHTCGATTGNAAYCWGNNTTGQLGDGSGSHQSTPALVTGNLAFAQVSAGGEHSCGATTGQAVYCWGANTDGQLGDGTTDVHISATPVLGGATFARVIAGGFRSTCGLTPDGDVYCWGFGSFGQLGNGVAGRQLEPTLVTGGLTFSQVSVGTYHTCGVTTERLAYCWGLNSNGQIGDGTAEQRLLPTRVRQ